MGDVACAVELGALAAVPEVVELLAVVAELFGDYGVAASHSCETCCLGVAAEFNGAVSGSRDFVDGVGDVGVLDICFVGCIVEYEAALGVGVVYPLLELVVGEYGACGVAGGRLVSDCVLRAWVIWFDSKNSVISS